MLLRVGFTREVGHPAPCALLPHIFTIAARIRHKFSVALSLRSPSPAVSRHPCSVEPGLSSRGPKAARDCLTYSPILYRKSGVLSIRLQKCTQNRRRRQQNSRNRAGEILLPRGADAVACAAHSCNRRHRQCHLADHTPCPPSAELRRFISPLRRRINSASTSNFDSG